MAHPSHINLKLNFLQKKELFEQGKQLPHSNLCEAMAVANVQRLDICAVTKQSQMLARGHTPGTGPPRGRAAAFEFRVLFQCGNLGTRDFHEHPEGFSSGSFHLGPMSLLLTRVTPVSLTVKKQKAGTPENAGFLR